MFRSVIIAFSTYSKLPMPHFEWKKEDLKYTMCAFPLVGLVLAFIQYGVLYLMWYFGAGTILTAGILTLIPFLVTGGIHMDGYMDTCDARCSYGDRAKKLTILKDPHIGAFAVIHAICYIMLTFALFTELYDDLIFLTLADMKESYLAVVLIGYILSRILSGLSVVTFKKAKDDGMVSDMSKALDNKVKVILLVELVLIILTGVLMLGLNILIALIPAAVVFTYYRYFSYKQFGGITGDLAGWFLQVCELSILVCAAIIKLTHWL